MWTRTKPARVLDHGPHVAAHAVVGRDRRADRDPARSGDLRGHEPDAADVQVAVLAEKPSSDDRWWRTRSPSSSVTLRPPISSQPGGQRLRDRRLARAGEAGHEHGQATLVERRVAAPQLRLDGVVDRAVGQLDRRGRGAGAARPRSTNGRCRRGGIISVTPWFRSTTSAIAASTRASPHRASGTTPRTVEVGRCCRPPRASCARPCTDRRRRHRAGQHQPRPARHRSADRPGARRGRRTGAGRRWRTRPPSRCPVGLGGP